MYLYVVVNYSMYLMLSGFGLPSSWLVFFMAAVPSGRPISPRLPLLGDPGASPWTPPTSPNFLGRAVPF